jgi:hypothetical protein
MEENEAAVAAFGCFVNTGATCDVNGSCRLQRKATSELGREGLGCR